MAWGVKYQHTGCTDDGRPEIILIAEEDWTGSIKEVDAGPIPFVKAAETATEGKFEPLRATTATITLVCDEEFDLEFLWTADERKYRVERWVDGGLDWRGYIVPNGYRYDYRGGLYYATITAADGLSTLSNVPFLSESGESYGLVDLTFNDGNRYPIILIITECLRKLDLDLNVWTCVGIRESRMPVTGAREADPLAYTTVDVRTYINDTQRDDIPYWQDTGAVWDCDRVLRNVLTIFGCKLYQESGTWRVKYINDDAAISPRQWRKYNTAAVYIGQEEVEDNLVVECEDDVLVNGNHVMAMDRVFSQVRVNYRYTFLREGDTPDNLILNGNLVWNPAFLHPGEWQPNYVQGYQLYIERDTYLNPCAPTGICTAVDFMGTRQISTNWQSGPTQLSWLSSNVFNISQGDNIMMKWWHRTPPLTTTDHGGTPGGGPSLEIKNASYGVYAIGLRANANDPNTYHWLVNDGVNTVDPNTGASPGKKTKWVQSPDTQFIMFTAENTTEANDYWAEVELDIPPAPISGEMFIRVYGLASPLTRFKPHSIVNFLINPIYLRFKGLTPIYNPDTQSFDMEEKFFYTVDNNLAHLTATGFFAGLIKNVSSEEVPKIHAYLYPETPRQRYTDRNDPIEIFNGDTVDINHVSSLRVNGINGKLYWDTWDGKYGYSSLGLLLARSIAEQYWLPNRILEGDFQHKNINMNTRITFDFIPGVTFTLQRGAWDTKHNTWGGTTLVQVADTEIPEGGSDDGNTINPVWQDTGQVRCIKEGGLNTGQTEKQQQDVNPASNSFGQTRWVPGGDDLDMCPVGEPDYYYWGAEPAVYDTDNFSNAPWSEEPSNGVQVSFSNDGGKYLYFLHLESLGVINSVRDQMNSETISDWQYLSDQVINGYTYKVFRMNYVTTVYSGVPMTFYFI